MKQIILQRLNLVIALLTVLTTQVKAATVNIPTKTGTYISWNDATGTGYQVENDGANVGSTGKSTNLSFTINNTVQQDYSLTFALGSKYAAKMRVTLKGAETTVLDQVVAIPNTGSWTPSEVQVFYLEQLPAGQYTLSFRVTEASSYAGNWGKLAFYAGDAMAHVPGTLIVSSGIYDGGARTENNDDNVGWIVTGSTAKYSFVCDEPGVYEMSTLLQRYNQGGTINIKVVDTATGTTEVDGDYVVSANASANYVNTRIPMAGEMTKGIKKMTFTFSGGSSFICNYKALTLKRVADHWACIKGVTIEGQKVNSGNTNDWECNLPKDYAGERVSFNVQAVHGSLTISAIQDGKEVEVTDLSNGTYSIPTPAPNQETIVTATLTPSEGALTGQKTYTLRLFRIGDIRIARATVDGFDLDGSIIQQLNDATTGYVATLSGNIHTSMPTVQLILPDGTVVKPTAGSGTLDGNKATYRFHARMGDMERDYQLTVEGIYIYNQVEGKDETVDLKFVSNCLKGSVWTNGLYQLSSTGGSFSGWESDTFYFNQNQGDEKSYTWTLPRNAVVKQMILCDFHAGYDNANGTEGELSGVTSPGATVYIPQKHYYEFGDDKAYNLIINIENHQAGQPVTFRLKGGWRPIASFRFVLERQPMTDAPVLKSKVINNTSGNQNSRVVTLTFDREIKQATATVGSQTLTGGDGSNVVRFSIWDLDYGKDYSFTLTTATDNYGNTLQEPQTLDFTVGSKPAVEQKVYDYVVGTTDELLSAIKTVNSKGGTARKTIFLKNGIYTMPVATTVLTAANLSIIGQSREGVIILGTSKEDGHGSAIIKTEGNNLYLQDLTLRTSHWRTGEFFGRLLAVYGTSEKIVMKRVDLEGQQDTYLCGHLGYHEDCGIYGTVDFIYSGGDNFFQHCDIVIENRKGNVITAPATSLTQRWGMVFDKCTIKPAPNAPLVTNGSFNLGRPWHNEPRTYYLNTTMEVKPSDTGWAGMSNVPTHFYEYNSTDKNGQPIDLSKRGNAPSSTNNYKPVLTDEEAALYTARNVLGGQEAWDAASLTRQLPAPQGLQAEGTVLQWQTVADARCYVIFKGGEYVGCTADTSFDLDTAEEGDVYTVRTANQMGGLGDESQPFTVHQSASDVKEKTPAFPGAEGYGRYVTGGRGGKVYHVTNLNDSGTGSLRWACEQSGTRTIVFDVSGTIHLKSQLKLRNGNVTIAGQTAPGDGICVADWDFTIAAPNVILRYLRFRPGETSQGEPDGLGGMDGRNVIVDHCSVSWSVDECCSVYGNEHMTVQWCIISQSLRNSTHAKSAHGYGGNWGGKGATYHHNLVAHHDSRTPRFGNRPTFVQQDTTDYRNNVIYNWAGNGCYGGEGMKVNMVNNYYKPGPATDGRASGSRKSLAYRICGLGVSSKEDDGSYHIWGKYYVDGNENPDYPKLKTQNWEMGIYPQISTDNWGYTSTTKDTMRLREPLPFMRVTTHTPEQAYERVLSYAGASLHRDALDEVIVSDTRQRKATYTGDTSKGDWPGIIDTPFDLKPAGAAADWSPWPELTATAAPQDTDGDGMPDEWETANGLDPNNITDGALRLSREGYTNLELYLNSLVAHITEAQNEGGTLEGYMEYVTEEDLTGAINIPTEQLNPDKAEIIISQSGKKAAKVLAGSFDSFSHGDEAQFLLNCKQQGTYTIRLDAATTRSDFKLKIEMIDVQTGNIDASKTLTISNTGNWQKYQTYTFDTNEMTTGTKRLTMTWQSTSGQYTGNVKNISIILKQADAVPSVAISSQQSATGVYDLHGRRVEDRPHKRGIYIKNGKKIII